MNKELFQRRLVIERNAKKWGQITLAKRSGLSQASIACYERGLKNPSQESIDKIAKALEVSPEYLIGISDQKN